MSNSSAIEDRIRQEAYRLWEEAGRPHGRDAEFWHQACALAEREVAKLAEAVPPAPKPRKKAAERAPAAASARPRSRKAGAQPTNSSP